MSIQYCHYCDEHIDTDYNTEHFCTDCGDCIEERGRDEIEPEICEECGKVYSDILATERHYRETQG